MKIALAQINPTVGDFAGNAKKILEYATRADTLGVGLVVFPELAVCGYPPADLLEKASFVARAEQVVAELAGWTATAGRPAILCGTVMATKASVGKQVRNVAALLDGGRVSFVQQKMLLPFYDVFDEQRYFEPAAEQTLVCVGGEPLAITICEDAWNDKGFWPRQMYPVDPVEKLMGRWESQPKELAGQQRVILNISASPYWQGKPQVRQNMLAALARRHHAFVAMTNQVGGNDSLVFDGSSLVIRPDGHVVARAASFAEDLVVFDTRDGEAIAAATQVDEVAAMWSALVLGTRDYVRKCGFSKALVGLSGGIDSALVAAIAVEALGKENVIGVGMPTEYSSLGSIDDARKLAKNLGVRFELLPIHDVFAQFQHVLQPLFAGTPFGLAEENLQPRIRGTLLMALSNKFGALVLTTGNKSEMSTGYCTLYGDMVGALAVIGDVMKMRVYALSRYVNRVKEVIPWETISKPPSAELRPEQRDTDSLPPYEVLDPILEAYVERYCSAEQIAEEQGVDVALVRSVLQLVEKSEYKRQQAAPVLKVTRKSFGMGRRFPIAVKVQV
ncbi:NAD+ synthase [Tunturiibacter gelidoferens]|uniref:NAD+ synthase (Glutamine-hydrolyzing) n=1 Tax=Tunturiibacter gelidiferens TaxID=3069689 RepID=A0ACC5NXK8_9BACT|nr:NAD+ synthase (glutamine-hydrolyzing) [Edaphobacter lichenicola]